MSLVYNIKRTKLEPDSVLKVGDWELLEDDNGHIFVFEITGLMSSAGVVNECRNEDVLHMWSTTIPYSRWDEKRDIEEAGDYEEIDITEAKLEDIKKKMSTPTQEQLDILKKLEFYIGYIDGEWKKIDNMDDFVKYHPECIKPDGSFIFSH